jgi:flagellar L-ring protein precursor FlgH
MAACALPLAALADEASSLYHPQSFRALVTDHRAAKVGDSLVVLVYESATATNQAATTVNKKSSISLGASDNHNSVGGKFNTASDADGGGVEKRSGELLARVSATVVGIDANGDLRIEGRQHISLNNENQTITVSGSVRPADIDTSNAVLSTHIADADIRFIGQGLLSSREKPGFITRFFNWLF